jgi:hypothetical protein
MFVPRWEHITSTLPSQQGNAIYRLVTTVYITILDITHRPAFYLKHTMNNVRTSQERHNVSTTSSTC